MDILSFTGPHDGSLSLLQDGDLEFHIEGEKDSHPRFAGLTGEHMLYLLSKLDSVPSILATSAITNPSQPHTEHNQPYFGTDEKYRKIVSSSILGKPITRFFTTHERSHIMGTYAMSPFPQGQPCYALCWEGMIGKFYRIDSNVNITEYPTVYPHPGWIYMLPFLVAKTRLGGIMVINQLDSAGKAMALAGFAQKTSISEAKWKQLAIDYLNFPIKENDHLDGFTDFISVFQQASFARLGESTQDFKDFMYYFSQGLFDKFYNFAKQNLKEKLPLLISGGCGLNCDWNTAWKNSGLFSDIFVAPVTNDSGISIGAAVDAQHAFTGSAKISWAPFAGEYFIHDIILSDTEYTKQPLQYELLSQLLLKNQVVAWVQGKYEIGPRALCHRSLIASPLDKNMTDTLNTIKHRESYRPIAPVCPLDSVSQFFEWEGESPYMLYFSKVRGDKLPAITHADGTARVQTTTSDDRITSVLKEFERLSGVPVLCNTSLNYVGKGFINRMSDLHKYTTANKINILVVEDMMYIRK